MYSKFLKLIRFSALVLILSVAMPKLAFSQAIVDYEIEEVLGIFKNYRFGNVYVYAMANNAEVQKYFRAKEEASTPQAAGGKEVYEALPDDVKSVVNNYYEEGIREITKQLDNKGVVAPDIKTLETAIEYKIASANKKVSYYKGFVVTTKPSGPGAIPSTYIGMLIAKTNNAREVSVNDALRKPIGKDYIFTRSEMTDTKLDINEYGAANFYDLVDRMFKQGGMKNVSLEAKDIGTALKWAGKEYGRTNALVKYDTRYEITDKVLQEYKKISEGNPAQIGDLTNEVIISPDLIRWQNYSKIYASTYDEETETNEIEKDEQGNPILDQYQSSNNNLPNFGMELKYGVEGLFYNSFWSERLSLNAIWKSMKLGVILPTNGWSSLSKDVYDQNRKFTTSNSIGLGGKIDFPMNLIKKSDVFEFSFGYVFGDAKESSYIPKYSLKDFQNATDPIALAANSPQDYLLRGNAQLHYTFAMNIDEDYLLRFGLGGTLYSVESWGNFLDTSSRTSKLGYQKNKTETVGGVSGRVDFMAKGNATPYGLSAMYFDETIGISAWLQIPVIDNVFALRLEANGYAVAFKGDSRIWENSSIFTPMLRIVYNF